MGSVRHSHQRHKTRRSGSEKVVDRPLVDVDVLWRGLAFARDNKALLMARHGTVLNANAVACQLFKRSPANLIGADLTELIDGYSPSIRHAALWETTLTLPAAVVPVEITQERLGDCQSLDVFAIRDLRPR
jgi:hypothetical protein